MQVHPPSTAAIAGIPLHAVFVPFPIACFTLTLLTDIAYWQTGNLMWKDFSSWLLFAGLILGTLAALAGLVDLLFSRRVRKTPGAWPHALGNLIVLGLAFLNSLVHAHDGWTAIVPYGLVLSALTVILMIFTVHKGRAMVYRHGVGVYHHDQA